MRELLLRIDHGSLIKNMRWVFLLLAFTSLARSAPDRRGPLIVRASDVEQQLINRFTDEGDIASYEELKSIVGELDESFIDFRHYDYNQLTAKLKNISEEFPSMTSMYTAGRSVDGRELWVLVVSKTPKEHTKGVPEFKYIANMHGNEVSGRVFLVYLAELLLRNYETNEYIRRLVDTTRIHLMPSMNPDGYEKSTEGDDSGIRGRMNKNHYDLNRNFPPRFRDTKAAQPTQPETAAAMKWIRSLPFVLSANLHGGTAIVNYPFDDSSMGRRNRRASSYSPAPDNELFVRLAYTYARAHKNMWKPGPRCRDSWLNYEQDPRLGIVNGAEWYVVSGGMQDWNYVHTNCMELTVEINCVKFPPRRELKNLWEENKYALLHYIDQTHNAIHGFITDARTGAPIENATISIDTKSKIVTSFAHGEFWRLVNLGNYSITIDHPDYIPNNFTVEITLSKRSHRLDASLLRLGDALPVPTRDGSAKARKPDGAIKGEPDGASSNSPLASAIIVAVTILLRITM